MHISNIFCIFAENSENIMRRYSKHSRNKVFEFQEYTSANGAFSLLSFDNPPKIDYESIHDIFVQLSAISEIDDTSLELSELGVVTDKFDEYLYRQRVTRRERRESLFIYFIEGRVLFSRHHDLKPVRKIRKIYRRSSYIQYEAAHYYMYDQCDSENDINNMTTYLVNGQNTGHIINCTRKMVI